MLQVCCWVLRHAEAQYTAIQSCKRLQLLVWPSARWMEASAALTLHCIHNTGKISALETQLKCRNSRSQTGRCHQRADRLLRGKKLHHILSFTSHLLTLTWKLMSLLTHNSCTKTESEPRVLKNKKLLQSSAVAPTWRIDKNDLSFPCSSEWNIIKTNVCFWLLPTVGKLWDVADSFRQKVWWTERESMHHLLRPVLNEKAPLQMN